MRFLYPHTRPSKKCSVCRSSQWHSWRHQTSGLKPAAIWLAWAKPMWCKTWANKKAGREIVPSVALEVLAASRAGAAKTFLSYSVKVKGRKIVSLCLPSEHPWKTPFKWTLENAILFLQALFGRTASCLAARGLFTLPVCPSTGGGAHTSCKFLSPSKPQTT